MAALSQILIKGKNGAFTNGELAEREIGIDTSTGDIYVSKDGTTVTKYDVSEIGGGGGGGLTQAQATAISLVYG